MSNPELLRIAAGVVGAAALCALPGCLDPHHFDHHDDHHAHHDNHHDQHATPYPVLVSRPAPPAQAPVTGPGHWVWDDTTQRYLWVSEQAR